VVRRRHQDYAFSVLETGADEPANGSIEKVLVLIELHDVIAGRGIRHHLIPGLPIVGGFRRKVSLRVHR